MADVYIHKGLTKQQADQVAEDYKKDGATVEIVQEVTGSYTVKATYESGSLPPTDPPKLPAPSTEPGGTNGFRTLRLRWG